MQSNKHIFCTWKIGELIKACVVFPQGGFPSGYCHWTRGDQKKHKFYCEGGFFSRQLLVVLRDSENQIVVPWETPYSWIPLGSLGGESCKTSWPILLDLRDEQCVQIYLSLLILSPFCPFVLKASPAMHCMWIGLIGEVALPTLKTVRIGRARGQTCNFSKHANCMKHAPNEC